jgi:pimeloyl-ACP methyl ester carboxylesterase
VIGGSAGALPAAAFALRHPGRCSHLVLLVPAMNLEGRDPVAFTALQAFFVERLLGSDLWFGAALQAAPGFLMRTLLATDPALLASVAPRERERARLILNELMPVSARTRGMLHDARMAGAPTALDLSAIRVPTLVVSAEDDLFGTAGTARTIAGRVPGARLLMLPDGGHIWLGHDDEVARAIARFVQDPPA